MLPKVPPEDFQIDEAPKTPEAGPTSLTIERKSTEAPPRWFQYNKRIKALEMQIQALETRLASLAEDLDLAPNKLSWDTNDVRELRAELDKERQDLRDRLKSVRAEIVRLTAANQPFQDAIVNAVLGSQVYKWLKAVFLAALTLGLAVWVGGAFYNIGQINSVKQEADAAIAEMDAVRQEANAAILEMQVTKQGVRDTASDLSALIYARTHEVDAAVQEAVRGIEDERTLVTQKVAQVVGDADDAVNSIKSEQEKRQT